MLLAIWCTQTQGEIPPTFKVVAEKLLWCAGHALAFQFIGVKFPVSYCLEQEFFDQSWLYKV
jgi:hypothetical protein